MLDKNGVPVKPGCYVRATPDEGGPERIIYVEQVTYSGEGWRLDVEVLDEDDPEVQDKLAAGYEGGGGSFGGGGASGSW